MRDEVIVICPEIAPGSGGVADYTLRVVGEWKGKFPLRFIIPVSTRLDSRAELNVELVERNRTALRKKLPAQNGRVLLQYSAYGFDRFGYPRWLLQALVDWKESGGGSLVVMLHEIWTFWPVLNRNYLIQQLHRRDLRTLLGSADAIFTSTESQAGHLRKLEPSAAIEVLPVGSTIVPRAASDREPGLAVLFGSQGTRLRGLRLMQTELNALASASLLTKLVTMGGPNNMEGDQEETEILRGLPTKLGEERCGLLPEVEISGWLARASFGISAQDELSMTKSGTFMAYAAHGLNILSPFANSKKPEPICWLTNATELLRGLPEHELATRAAKLCTWQERTASWTVIAARFAAALSA